MMPLSLNLPYSVCWPLTRMVRRATTPGTTFTPANGSAAYIGYQYYSTDRLRQRFMDGIEFVGRTVIDVGSGLGGRAPYFVEQGARMVHCIDVNRRELATGAALVAERFPVAAGAIEFIHPDEIVEREFADLAILVDSFEHLVDPRSVLMQVNGWLRPGGLVWIGSIGWYNYMASHCLAHIPIPWCQIVFSEQAILRTIRSLLRSPGYEPNVWEREEGLDRWDGVRTLKDRPGEPLNMLSLRGIKRVLAASPFEVRSFRVYGFSGTAVPGAWLVNGLTRIPPLNEVFHSYYSVVLAKPSSE